MPTEKTKKGVKSPTKGASQTSKTKKSMMPSKAVAKESAAKPVSKGPTRFPKKVTPKPAAKTAAVLKSVPAAKSKSTVHHLPSQGAAPKTARSSAFEKPAKIHAVKNGGPAKPKADHKPPKKIAKPSNNKKSSAPGQKPSGSNMIWKLVEERKKQRLEREQQNAKNGGDARERFQGYGKRSSGFGKFSGPRRKAS